MPEARSLVEDARYPRHHLWGVDALSECGYDVEYLPSPRLRRGRIAVVARRTFGDPIAERAAWRSRGPDAVCFSASTAQFAGASTLRHFGLWPMPVVTVVHPSVPDWVLSTTMLRGYDVVLSPSRRLADELVTRRIRSASSTLAAPWGPGLDFPGYAETSDDGIVVSSGKVDRDIATLLRALAIVGCPARVYGRPPHGVAIPPNVTMVPRAPYLDVLRDLARARVVAIPLSVTERLVGLTEINDALALAKPVVMTRNPYVDPDPSADGFGITVPSGRDAVQAWADALGSMMSDSDHAAELGRQGREYAERGWNANAFAQSLSSAMHMALAAPARRVLGLWKA